MPLVELTQKNFEEIIMTFELSLVDFWAEWCSPCQNFSIIYQNVAKQFPEVLFGKVNIETQSQLAEVFEIRSIPMLMIFRKNLVVFREAGLLSEDTLIELIQQAKAIDGE